MFLSPVIVNYFFKQCNCILFFEVLIKKNFFVKCYGNSRYPEYHVLIARWQPCINAMRSIVDGSINAMGSIVDGSTTCTYKNALCQQ